MSLSDRRKFLIVLAALPLAGCGFTPMLKGGTAARGLQGALHFNLIDSRMGYLLLGDLETRFGPSSSPRYDVVIDLKTQETKIVLTAATGVSRITLDGIAKISVTPVGADAPAWTGHVHEQVGYSRTAETAASGASQRDAEDRLVRGLAEKIANELAANAARFGE